MTAVTSTTALPSQPAAFVSAPAAPVRGGGFAQMLDAHRADSAPAPAPDAPTSTEAEAGDKAHAARTAEESRQRQLRANRQVPRTPGAEAPVVREPKVRDAAESDTEAIRAARRPAPVDDLAAADPALMDWLAALSLPPAEPTATGPRVAAEGAAPETDPAKSDLLATAHTAERGSARRATAQSAHGGAADLADARADARGDAAERRPSAADEVRQQREATDPQAAARAPQESPALWQAALEQAVVPPAEARSRGAEAAKVDGTAAAAALAAATPAAERPSAEAPAPTVVHLPTPADAPEFPQVLGAQLSVFAKDGIQQAELHLNPADMGSISVQIALDGDQARVDFGADSAATRQLIENGLPELASALRDAGFTLSGGGVHSQAQQQSSARQRDGGASNGRATGRADGGGEAASPPAGTAARTVRVGGVDLYA